MLSTIHNIAHHFCPVCTLKIQPFLFAKMPACPFVVFEEYTKVVVLQLCRKSSNDHSLCQEDLELVWNGDQYFQMSSSYILPSSSIPLSSGVNVLQKKNQNYIYVIWKNHLCGSPVDTVTDFLIDLDMKPCMHLVKISIFSLNNVIVRPTKIMKRAEKSWAYFYKIKYILQK